MIKGFMDCINCGVEINPKFVMAIQNNICPACNKPIMDDSGAELLRELTFAMEQMPNDPQGLAGWLLSNYRLIKIGSAEPIEFKERNGKRKKASAEQHNSFFERAMVTPKTKNKPKNKVDKVAAKILAETEAAMYGGDDEEEEDYEEEEYEDESYEEDRPLPRVMNNDLIDKKAGKPLNDYEQEELFSVFNEPNKVESVLEMNRLQKLQEQEMRVSQSGHSGIRRA